MISSIAFGVLALAGSSGWFIAAKLQWLRRRAEQAHLGLITFIENDTVERRVLLSDLTTAAAAISSEHKALRTENAQLRLRYDGAIRALASAQKGWGTAARKLQIAERTAAPATETKS